MLKRIVSACIAGALAWTVCTAVFGEAAEAPAAPVESAAELPGEVPAAPAENPQPEGAVNEDAANPVNPENPEAQAQSPEAREGAAEDPAPDAANPAAPEAQAAPEAPAENPGQDAVNPAAPEAPAENPAQGAETPAASETPAENPAQGTEAPAEQPGVQPADPAPNGTGEGEAALPAENPEPAQGAETPAGTQDEEPPACGHESTEVIYYFDFPDYRPLDAETHVAFGRATAEVRCTVCGALLSSYMEENAEEICSHVFQKGRCVLCGREQEIAPAQPEETAVPAVRESVMTIPPTESNSFQYFFALTENDLEEAGDTLVLRPDGCDTALVLQADKLRAEIEKSGGSFIAEIERPKERNVSATLRMYTADGAESVPEWQEISLRIYQKNSGTPLVVSYTSPKGTTSSEEAGWIGHGTEGYWNVTWLGNGIYEY